MVKQLIEKIEINKFRSFSSCEMIKCNNLNIFSGKNNVGKSNVLKVLNLFFNNQTGFNESFDFVKDYNKGYSGNRGHTNEIVITIHFSGKYTNSNILKDGFAIKKKFIKDNLVPEITYYQSKNKKLNEILKRDKKYNRKITSFRIFYNKLKFIYVPAIRDKNFITHIFTYLQEILETDKTQKYKKSFKELTQQLKQYTKNIEDDFKQFMNVETSIEAPQEIQDILAGIKINLKQNYQVKIKTNKKDNFGNIKYNYENPNISIDSSGDGIMMSYIPHYLNYFSRKLKNKNFIWGFEEPENSLEYSKVQDLALKFLNEFAKRNQIFLTTHSPAFINLKLNDKVNFYRVYKKDTTKDSLTKIQTEIELKEELKKSQDINDHEMIQKLNEEIHFVDLSNEIEKNIKKILSDRLELDKQQAELEKKAKYIADIKPEKVFIYEDKKKRNFWKNCLKKAGLNINKIKFITSEGCSNMEEEIAIKKICKKDINYKPKVYRINDLDGLPQKYSISVEKYYKQKFKFKYYKFKLLPVCEIENLEIINNLDVFKNWLKEQDDKFIYGVGEKTRSALNNCYYIYNKFNIIDSFNLECKDKDKNISAMMLLNIENKLYNFVGKEIINKAKNDGVNFKSLKDTKFDDFPKLFKDLLNDIVQFFNKSLNNN